MINNNFYATDKTTETQTQFFINNYIIENWDKPENEFLDSKKAMLIADLKKSGLSPETVKYARLEIFSGSVDDLKELIGFSSIQGQSLTQACTILKIPYFMSNGEIIQYRVRLYPPLNNAKYLSPLNSQPIPYILPDVWKVKDKKNKEIWIVEGEKKALRLIQENEFAIAISGIWQFKAGKDSENTAKDKELWKEINEFIIPGRTIYLAFDSDMDKNDLVRKALFTLALTIQNKGVIVKIAIWDSKYKGIDDYLTEGNGDILIIKQNALLLLDFIKNHSEYIQDVLSSIKNISLNDVLRLQLQGVAKKVGVLKKIFDDFANSGKKQKIDDVKCGNLIIPSPYRNINNMLCVVKKIDQRTGDISYEEICPFFTVTNTIKAAENSKLTLLFCSNINDIREITIDAEGIGDARKLAAELNSKHIFVTSRDARDISDYIVSFLRANSIPLIKYIDQTGWNIDNTIFSAPGTILENNIIFSDEIVNKIKQNGDKNNQIDFLRDVFQNHMGVSFIISAGLASLLIKPLNLNNFVVFTTGRTGTGKTVANQIMLSLFGNQERLKHILNSTVVGAEILFSKLLDFPILLDEIETVGNTAEKINNSLVNIIYNFQSGIGRIRGQKNLQLKKTNIYRGLLFITSERSVSSILSDNSTQKANLGIYRRVLEINDKIKLFNENVNYAEIVSEINKNYGHILPLWADYIKNNLNIIKSTFFQIQSENYMQLGGKQNFIDLIYICHKLFLKNILNLEDEKITIEFTKTATIIMSENAFDFQNNVINEEEKYIYAIKEFAITSGRFINKIQEKKDIDNYSKPHNGIIGQIESEYPNDGGHTVYFYTNKAIDMLCREYKFEEKRFIESLKQKGYLVSGDSKGKFTIQKKIDGNPLRCYCFKVI